MAVALPVVVQQPPPPLPEHCVWAFRTGKCVDAAPVLCDGGRAALCCSHDGFVYCLDVEVAALCRGVLHAPHLPFAAARLKSVVH